MQNDELERAKLAAVSSVHMNLETRAVVAEDIGRQILTYGDRCGPLSIARTLPLALHCRQSLRGCQFKRAALPVSVQIACVPDVGLHVQAIGSSF